MLKITTLSLILMSQPLLAGTILKHTVCPNVTSDGQSLISNIQGLAEKLKQKPECKPIADQLSEVNQIISSDTWGKFKDIVTGEESTSLEGDELEALTTLTEKVSFSIAQTVSMISGNSSCIQSNEKASALSTISGVTKEVSNIIGNVTGPYGMAVSLGGNLLSGAISGIDKFFKSRMIYNFNNKDEELLFMNQFCAFTEVKKDVADFLGMENRTEELIKLKTYLNVKEKDLIENCPLCLAYSTTWKTKFQSDKIIKRYLPVVDINEISENPEDRNAFSRCGEIARAVYTSNSDLKQFYNILATYKNKLDLIEDEEVINLIKSDSELIAMLIGTQEILPEIFPSINECLSLDESELEKISQKFNLFIRDELLPQNEKIFLKQMNIFQELANRKYKEPLGDYIAKTMDRLVWIEKEARSVQKKLKDPNRSSDTQNIREVHEKLEDRIISGLMPAYLNFSINRNKRFINNFRNDLNQFIVKQLKTYRTASGSSFKSLAELISYLKESKVVDARIFLSEQRKIFDKLEIALDQTKNLNRYCEYLNYMASNISRNNKYCTAGLDTIASTYKKLESFHSEIKVMHGFNAWAERNLDIQSSRVLDYAEHIEQWSERGSARWELHQNLPLKPDTEEIIQQEIEQWINGDQFQINN